MNGRNKRTKYSVLLLYPDTLEAAMGSPGFKQVLLTLDNAEDIEVDWGWYAKRNNRIVYESSKWKQKYDCIAFSVPFELLYSNVVRCLTTLNIEPERSKRKPEESLVIIGGPVPTMNPAVAGVISDVVYIGEAEQHLTETISLSVAERKTRAAPKLTPMIGMRIPNSYGAASRFVYPCEAIGSSFYPGFDNPEVSAFKDVGLVEVGRGCSRGCRFCAAGHIYLPVRHRKVSSILKDVESYSGAANRIGLVGASISDHPHLKEIIRGIIDRGFDLTTSSFRADMLDKELVSLLMKGGLKTITIAPEGGSSRIRKIMNKRLSDENIIRAVQACAEAGIRNLRLYFMVGIPWEHESDIKAIADLIGRIRIEFGSPSRRITVSVNPFIPKPQTPFQWCCMSEPSYIEMVYRYLKKAISTIRGTSLKTLSMRVAVREAVISLGNEAVGCAIIENARDGIPWKKALSNNGADVGKLVYRMKPPDKTFPWDAVTGEKTKAALLASFEKARCAAENSCNSFEL